MTDYYSILGLNKNANDNDIKKAYRKLALKHHPDRGGDEKKFKEIQKAYEVLSDNDKKMRYDQFGDENNGGLEDMFSHMFQGGFQQKRKQNPNIIVNVTILEAWKGCKKEITKNIKNNCLSCLGNGTKDGSQKPKCNTCNGCGMIKQIRQIGPGMIQQIQRPCNICGGSGNSRENFEKCIDCNGEGKVKRENKFIINIPKGVMSGEQLEEEMGNGELVNIIFKVIDDERYKKQKLDLISPLYLKLKEAISGFSKEYIFPDGTKEQISYNKTLYHGSIMRMRRKGFEREDVAKGSLILVVHVCYDDFPTKLLNNKKLNSNIECIKSTETLFTNDNNSDNNTDDDDDNDDIQATPQCHQQ